MRFVPVFVLALIGTPLLGADWEKVTDGLAKKENAGYGGICGLLIDPSNGDILINISDRGLYRSTDQGKTFAAFAPTFKGRTEWPGCMTFDPTGKSKRLVAALVYGGKTWGKPIPLPPEMKGWSPLTWLDYDPKNDALYVMKMTSELYRLKR